jgi:type II secretory pathway pseudopilin PulG
MRILFFFVEEQAPMKNLPTKTMLAILALLAAATAQAQTREKQEESLDKYLPYAGAPVDHFQFWKLTQWELVGQFKVVVWPRLNEAFLLTVDPPCSELEWAKSIAVTSTANTVNRGFDSVQVGRDKCRINEIRPIDYKKYRQERMGAGKESK